MLLSRRGFLKGLAATVGAAGIPAAVYERLIPYARQPEDIIPGVATWYATSCRECPAGCGMIVRNRDSHAVKCEGNPKSPINMGKLCARGQAALHGLYDPDRIAGPMRRTGGGFEAVNWDEAYRSIGSILSSKPRIALISDLQTGSLESLFLQWLKSLGSESFTIYEPINYKRARAVSGGVVPTYHIDKSDFLISFGADFLETWISPVEYARRFAAMRRVKNGRRGKFVCVGSRVSATAANADVRIIVPPGSAQTIAEAIKSGNSSSIDSIAARLGVDAAQMRAAASGYAAAGNPLALPGLDADSALAAQKLNGSSNRLVDITRPHALSRCATSARVNALLGDMEGEKIDVLVMYGANPVYADPRFKEAMKRVGTVISLSSFLDETSADCHWLLPSNTPLESWGDYSPYPGIDNLMQPTMGTLFDTRHTGDILLSLAEAAGVNTRSAFKADTWYEYLRQSWGHPLKAGETPETRAPEWETLAQQGGMWEGEAPAEPLARIAGWSVGSAGASPSQVSRSAAAETPMEESGVIHLHTYPHIYHYDGRGANRRWLQEIPEPMTNGVWGTWAEIHPETARKLGVEMDDVVEITSGDRKISMPAIVWDGVAKDTVAVPIGQGHEEYGQFAKGVGANVLPLLNAGPAVQVRAAGQSAWAVRIGGSTDQHDREIVQTVSLGEHHEREKKIIVPLAAGYDKNDFYPPHDHRAHRWSMTVDLDKCIGCHACVAACYAENNLGVVGAENIKRRREMSWIRIDRYIDWSDPAAPVHFQPMLCQQCDAAPCEPVCPVYASSHSEEGLNMQVYNRCVGTRYCSHNCPYKVRRFNWFDYKWPSPMHLQLNPDVTVRCRGVMEKCTFCIQRIREAEINAKAENRDVRDGEITPACVQTCPTGVFTFGDLKNPDSRVSQIIADEPRAYQVLRELNTKPAVIYLKRIVDRNVETKPVG